MKKIIFATIIVVLNSLYGCKKCNDCDDSVLVSVKNGVGDLKARWEISTSVLHSNGTATSSISIAESGTSFTASRADSVTTNIYLSATDTLAGIKCVSISGGFGYTCTNNGLGSNIILDGIVPKKEECLPMTKCCLKSNRINIEDIKQFVKCPANYAFANGSMRVYGIIKTCNQSLGDTITLDINF